MELHLAPLHGVTNRVYRAAYFRHFSGFDGALAPFVVAIRCDEAKSRHFKDLLSGPGAEPSGDAGTIPVLAAQVLGDDPLAVAETAAVLGRLGYSEVNLNLGCPYSMVAKKGRGSGLLPFPDRVGAILDRLCAVPGIRASVKLRLGRSDPEDILRLIPVLNDHTLSRVIIHPRLGTQIYKGRADPEAFARAAEFCKHPVVYNGDLASRADYEALRASFPSVDSWMIGRGAIVDPFLAEELKTGACPGAMGRITRLRAWHEDLYSSYRAALCGPAHLLDKMKEVWTYLGASFPEKRRQLEAIARAKTTAEYERAAAAILGNEPAPSQSS
jgi:tRNA-dihydrouridine synthase B